MRLSLIVTTYERPDALAATLASIARQTVRPDELLVADDGSGEATQQRLSSFAERWPSAFAHVWQEHAGFGAGRARNRAIARATGDYVVLVDGDMVLHPEFIADHRDAAIPGGFVQGTRILLDAAATDRILAGEERLPGALDPGLGTLRRIYAIRSRRAARLMRRLANGFIAIKSCNQGFWREHLLHVNGFDEAMTGWGYEDKELCARLAHAGVRRRTLLFGALAYHLQHPPAERAAIARNRSIYERTLIERRVRAERGITAGRGDAAT